MGSMSLIDKWRTQSTQNFVPLQASLELTYRCNERCRHCYIDKFWDDPKRVLSLDQWKIVLDKLRDAGTLYLSLMGGEAMLNPHFWEICEYAKQKGFHISMITNGLKIKNQETADRLAKSGLKVATMSIYSLEDEIHDHMTKVRGSLKLTMQALNFLQNAGVKVGVNCLLTKHNIDNVFDLMEYFVAKGIEVREDPTVTPGFNGKTDILELRASKEQLIKFYHERAKRWPHSLAKGPAPQPEDYLCNVGKGKCAITPYGEILSCIDVRIPLGNLVQESFDSLWNSPEINKWRFTKVKDVAVSADCSNPCEACPAMSMQENGDIHTPTAHDVRLSEIKQQVRNELGIE